MNVAEAGTASRERGCGALASSRALPPPVSPRPVAATSAVAEAVRRGYDERCAIAALFRAFGDPGRLSLVGFLAAGERCGTECADHFGLAQSRISAHLARLVAYGVVSRRRAGRRVVYQIAEPRALKVLALGWTIAQGARRAGPGDAGTS